MPLYSLLSTRGFVLQTLRGGGRRAQPGGFFDLFTHTESYSLSPQLLRLLEYYFI